MRGELRSLAIYWKKEEPPRGRAPPTSQNYAVHYTDQIIVYFLTLAFTKKNCRQRWYVVPSIPNTFTSILLVCSDILIFHDKFSNQTTILVIQQLFRSFLCFSDKVCLRQSENGLRKYQVHKIKCKRLHEMPCLKVTAKWKQADHWYNPPIQSAARLTLNSSIKWQALWKLFSQFIRIYKLTTSTDSRKQYSKHKNSNLNSIICIANTVLAVLKTKHDLLRRFGWQ